MSAELPETQRLTRLIPRDGSERARIVAVGRRDRLMQDAYVRLLSASWLRLMLAISLSWIALNVLFAAGYMALGDGIANARPGSFGDLFFFSVETISTIGYGKMSPVTLPANFLMSFEALTGFIFYGATAGLIFSKFSRPTSRVIFSRAAVISPYNGVPQLMLRLANERNNRIVDARISMVILLSETTAEGHNMRRFHDLALTRGNVPLLQLTWTAMHVIDDKSPLCGMTPALLRERDAEIIVSLTGLDETLSQTIHARFSYLPGEIVFNAMFEDIIHRTADNRTEVHFHRFHDVRMLDVKS